DVFHRDDLGRIVRREISGVAQPHVFSYDAMSRLKKRTLGDDDKATELESYDYTPGGRMKTRFGGLTLSYTDSGGAVFFPNAVKSVSMGSDSLSYGFVPSYGLVKSINGTWAGKPRDSHYVYDVQRRLREVTSDGDTLDFGYDAGDERAARLSSSGSEFT